MKRLSRSAVYTPISVLNKNLLRRLRDDDASLVRIVFSSRDLGPRGADCLARALFANASLRELDLSSNSVGPEGAWSIARLLLHQTTRSMIASGANGASAEGDGIRTLKLCDNGLRDAGVKEMAAALENDVALEDLWLDDNFIGAAALAVLAAALRKNSRLRRLHLRHNSFASLSPVINCAFDRRSLDDVADSNHTLHRVFLDCGYPYECEELEGVLRINRTLGRVEARNKKIALFLEEDLGQLLRIDLDARLVHRLLGILARHSDVSTVFRVMRRLPSEVLSFRGSFGDDDPNPDPMDVDDDPMEVEYVSR